MIHRIEALEHPIELVKSEKSSLHCLQASLMMAVWSLLGERLSWNDAERLSGYVEGHYTWPYGMFVALAERGLSVVSIEDIDPARMAADPAGTIRRLYGDEAQAVIDDLDSAAESERIYKCLNDPRIKFTVRPPTREDVERSIHQDRLPLVSLDFGVLNDLDKFEGHMVLVSGISNAEVELFDPGPPGEGPRMVPAAKFERAMHSPSKNAGAVIILSRR